jgi:hypothetical protein
LIRNFQAVVVAVMLVAAGNGTQDSESEEADEQVSL